uniref:Uncharacterized protein n=1 Tax=Molossus molossus TaxID=27622 RepID=A0A7J8DQA7_MOLMO|nr:hypothetical protein HJG59_011592 [Molossus molossus]
MERVFESVLLHQKKKPSGAIRLPGTVSMPLPSATTHPCRRLPGNSPVTKVSWGSVAIFTTEKTRRATGLFAMTSSEGHQ